MQLALLNVVAMLMLQFLARTLQSCSEPSMVRHRRRKGRTHAVQRLVIALFGGGLMLGMADGVRAADTVLLRYRAFGRAVPVADLATLATTGEAPESLDGLLKMAGQDPAALQDLLTREASVNPTLLDRTLNSWPGEWALDQLGEAIHPPSGEASRQALRAAIVLSAADDQQLSLLEVLEKYPTPQVVVEGDRIESAYRRLVNVLNPLDIF